ncbi:PREDICTED: adenylate cyclase type 3 [Cyphomyrmex costatus]|uniref:Adenylate cyclase type 3 n=1 Tax=Cyphomyrmex costatus TaxID=456900 RepID=A0A195D4J1_9HYME|nr:PREDICTED: adenylate cyclase type 3 [Cyphomyrmex costatus]KYN07797.1 Adenylate cyclase type 3 [Cyphomyrmex costatus]
MSQQQAPTNEDSYLSRGKPLNLLKTSFSNAGLEKLYHASSLQQRRGGFTCFLASALLYGLYMFAMPGFQWPARFVNALFLCFNLFLVAWTESDTKTRNLFWSTVPGTVGMIWLVHLPLLLLLKTAEITPIDSLAWMVLLLYLLFATLPLKLIFCFNLAMSSIAIYTLNLIAFSNMRPDDYILQFSDILLLSMTLFTGACILGICGYRMAEFQQRRAFLETRQSLEVQLMIEQQSVEQERLLLSVLPEHIAVKMRQDLGGACHFTQFKKIYMSRHENVSILYADIVGFTAISSTYSASELVKILNELFARFDQLSERYEQMRIKILGDCYYCISGAPIERPDHAVLCVYMGLSMVEAIKYIQQTTNSPVDMRVGIHTGAVLAGVLGQKQWQFDVYSKDVELANKMESSGRAGRVHISNSTLSFLNGEFEVEPAHGEDREEALHKAGIVTYFIVKALKPFKPAVTKSLASLADAENSQKVIENVQDKVENIREDSEEFRQRLRKKLVSRGGEIDLKVYTNWFTLRFKSSNMEEAFQKNVEEDEAFSLLLAFGSPLVVICAAPIWKERYLDEHILFVFGIIMFSIIILAIDTCVSNPKIKALCTKAFVTFLTTVGLLTFVLLETLNCSIMDVPQKNTTLVWIPRCSHVSYYSFVGVLAMITISMPTYLCYLSKTFMLYSYASLQSCIYMVFSSGLEWEEVMYYDKASLPYPLKYFLSSTLFTVATALVIVMRYSEKARRMLYLRGREVIAQRERSTEMKRRNEVLIYNILPPHVATYFLSHARHHDDLYSQSYAKVGVLFASMPNFADFYSEETINNQGLECLRFLNEVISDFDAILDQEKFKSIIKIKTIGSTYMAASGISEVQSVQSEDSLQWNHLVTLVDFALELKKALSSINEQSFNHFVLKMGINHGPVTAGVIGARKPHYDIWGNTVNVASRMESTGKVGCIQVTNETRKILEPFGFGFEQRGLVFVKGKGQLLTHYLVSKDGVNLDLDSDLPVEPTHPIIYQ